MHNAKLETSERLRRVYKLLKLSRRPLSTRDIIRLANVCAVNSIMSELEANGIRYRCDREDNVYYYSLEG
jgi:hypothetical protein